MVSMVSLIEFEEALSLSAGEAVFSESHMLSLQRPSVQSYRAFSNAFHNINSPNGPYVTLGGYSERVYDNRRDLMALHRQPEEDKLSAFLRKYCAFLFVVSLMTVSSARLQGKGRRWRGNLEPKDRLSANLHLEQPSRICRNPN